jgi:hypothetical protein
MDGIRQLSGIRGRWTYTAIWGRLMTEGPKGEAGMYCGNCSHTHARNAGFCNQYGTQLRAGSSAQTDLTRVFPSLDSLSRPSRKKWSGPRCGLRVVAASAAGLLFLSAVATGWAERWSPAVAGAAAFPAPSGSFRLVSLITGTLRGNGVRWERLTRMFFPDTVGGRCGLRIEGWADV